MNVLAKGRVEVSGGAGGTVSSQARGGRLSRMARVGWVQTGTLPCTKLVRVGGLDSPDECLAVSGVIELHLLTAAFDPLTADTEGVKMALIISESGADLLCCGSFRETLGGFSHPLSPVPHDTTS